MDFWQPLAHFLFEVGMLKRTPRSGFQFLGSGEESVAEHSFRAAMIGYTLAQAHGQACAAHVALLCLFHDLPEARTGDLNYVNKKYVQVHEQKAVDDLAQQLPFGSAYQALMAEFSAAETVEARLAHDADQLEMILSLKECQDLGNRYAQEWYPFVRKRLRTPQGRALGERIWETDSSHWWFDQEQSHWWVHGNKKDLEPQSSTKPLAASPTTNNPKKQEE